MQRKQSGPSPSGVCPCKFRGKMWEESPVLRVSLSLPGSFPALLPRSCLLYLQLKHPTDPARQELRSWASSWQRDIEGLLQFLCTTSADGTWKRRWACHRCLLQCLVCKQDRRLSEVWELSISHRRGKNHKLLLKSYLRIELEMKEFLEFLRAAEMLFRLHLKGHVFWLFFFFKQVCNNCSFKKKRNIGTMELQ